MSVSLLIGVVVVAAGAAVGLYYLMRYVKPEVSHAVASLEGAVATLQRVVETKSAAITGHLEEIALHQKHVQVKSVDRERAQRIIARLNELLQ